MYLHCIAEYYQGGVCTIDPIVNHTVNVYTDRVHTNSMKPRVHKIKYMYIYFGSIFRGLDDNDM